MADDQKQSPTNFAGNSLILAALVATGTYYFVSREAGKRGRRESTKFRIARLIFSIDGHGKAV
jgi:hypothetical protein